MMIVTDCWQVLMYLFIFPLTCGVLMSVTAGVAACYRLSTSHLIANLGIIRITTNMWPATLLWGAWEYDAGAQEQVFMWWTYYNLGVNTSIWCLKWSAGVVRAELRSLGSPRGTDVWIGWSCVAPSPMCDHHYHSDRRYPEAGFILMFYEASSWCTWGVASDPHKWETGRWIDKGHMTLINPHICIVHIYI